MAQDLNRLLDQIKSHSAAYQELGQLLAQSANDILASGVPPSEELLAAIASARAEFSSLKKKLADLGFNDEATKPLTSLKSIEQLVEQRLAQEQEAAKRDKMNRIIPMLNRISQIGTSSLLYQEALKDCRAKALQVQEQLQSLAKENQPLDASELEELIHPFEALLTLLEAEEQLDDEAWLDLTSTVEKSFGTPLALAASRKKLYIEGLARPQASLPADELEPSPENKIISELRINANLNLESESVGRRGGKWTRVILVLVILAAALAAVALLSQGSFPDGLELRRYGVPIKNINQPLENQGTYLMQAVKEKNLRKMTLLIKHGAQINQQDSDTNTALHLAVMGNYFEGAEMLIQNGANPALRNRQGKTPGEIALAAGNADIASLLPEGSLRTPRDTANARNPFSTQP